MSSNITFTHSWTNICTLAALAAGVSSACIAAEPEEATTAGLLGERYIAVSYDYVGFDDGDIDNGDGISIVYNQALNEDLDLTVGYSYLDSGISGVSQDVQTISVGAIYHTAIGKGRGFVGAEAGVAFASGYDDDSSVPFAVVAGYERPIGERFAVTPYISWTDAINSDVDGAFGYGVLGEWRMRGALSLIATIDFDDDHNYGVSFGAAFRF